MVLGRLTPVNGLSSLSSTFAPRPDGQPLSGTLPSRSQIERQSLDAVRARQIVNQVADLIRFRGDLNTAYGRLTSSVQTIEQVQERMQIAQSQIDLIEQCRPKSVRTELTTVPPGPFRIPGGTGTSRFIIQGGKAPYRAELLQAPVPGLDVRERPAFSAHVEVTAKDAAAGTSSILITDGTGSTTVVGLEIGAAAASPPGAPASAGPLGVPRPTSPGVTAPTALPRAPRDAPLQPARQPEGAFLSEDQQKMVQRRLCVKDDGDFGKNTRRTIREYQESVGQPPTTASGVLSAEQAEAVLGLNECPRQFQTYYELLMLQSEEAVKDLQQRLNEANKRGIIILRVPLEVTGELNTSTREALKSFQVKSGVSPADGLYSPKTFDAIIRIRQEGSPLSPDL